MNQSKYNKHVSNPKLIDTSINNHRTLTDHLLDKGHSTREFLDLVEVLEVLRKAPGDQEAILLDLGLPKMNGIQWLKKVRREVHPYPEGLISRDVNVEVTKEIVNLNLTAMLVKPFSSAELRKVLMRLGHTFQSGNPNLIPEHPDSTSPKSVGRPLSRKLTRSLSKPMLWHRLSHCKEILHVC